MVGITCDVGVQRDRDRRAAEHLRDDLGPGGRQCGVRRRCRPGRRPAPSPDLRLAWCLRAQAALQGLSLGLQLHYCAPGDPIEADYLLQSPIDGRWYYLVTVGDEAGFVSAPLVGVG